MKIEIRHAFTKQQRIEILEKASKFFNHDSVEAHDREIKAGAEEALCLKLGYALLQFRASLTQKRQQLDHTETSTDDDTILTDHSSANRTQTTDEWYELSLICSSIHCILEKCSSSSRQSTFDQVGKTELLLLLMQLLELALQPTSKWMQFITSVKKTQQYVQPDIDMSRIQSTSHAIKKTMLILSLFSKIENAKKYLIRFRKGILMTRMTKILSIYPFIINKKSSYSSSPRKITSKLKQELLSICETAICIVKDLTHRFVEEDAKKFPNHHKLIDSIHNILSIYTQHHRDNAKISNTTNYIEFDTQNSKVTEHASKAIWNMARIAAFQQLLMKQDDLVHTLMDLASSDNEKIANNCISAIGNLVTVPVDSEEPAILENDDLVAKLIDISLSEMTSCARRRATRAIRCLASTRAVTSMKSESILAALENVVLEDGDRATRIQGTEALVALSSAGKLIDEKYDFSPMLRTMLRIMSVSEDSTCVEIICKNVPKVISSISKFHPFDLGEFTDFEIAVSKVALSEEFNFECKLNLARLLHRLSRDENNRLHLSTDNIINALSSLVEIDGLEKERLSTHAAATIVNLSENGQCRQRIASHESILTNLVNYLVIAPAGSVKNEVKETILTLLPDL